MEMGDIELAQRHLQMVPDMPAPVEVRALARNGLREIAVRGAEGSRAEDGCSLLSAGCHAAVLWEIAE